jgi:type IV pilus biogenesis protein CpaD/CtpE
MRLPPTTLLLIALGAGLAGCAAAKPLHTEASSAAIRTAEELGANEDPQAALHLRLAQEALEAATALNQNGQKEEANSLLLRAEADAELAVALAHAEGQREEARLAVERVRKLQTDNPYAPGGAN